MKIASIGFVICVNHLLWLMRLFFVSCRCLFGKMAIRRELREMLPQSLRSITATRRAKTLQVYLYCSFLVIQVRWRLNGNCRKSNCDCPPIAGRADLERDCLLLKIYHILAPIKDAVKYDVFLRMINSC